MRRPQLRFVLLLLLLGLAVPSSSSAREPREERRIEYLLHSVGSLPGAVFIRNGSEYDAPAAEKHLRQKLNYAGERLKTAEQFIEYCATRSSVSGQLYKIRLADGSTVESAAFFRAKLAGFDKTQS